MAKTRGEQRVRVEFNPSDSNVVSQIKQKSAELINICEDLRASAALADEDKVQEMTRLASLAMTYYETACMHAVKTATVGK